jgi:uncharacterized tellurite resistance protein B-like protein
MADFAITQNDMNGVSEEQQSTVFDALVTAAWADGKVSDAEMKRFEEEVVKIPWGKPEAELIKMIHASTARVGALKDKDAVLAFIKAIADKLPKQDFREKVLHTMVQVMYADKDLNAEEKNVIMAFVEAFGVTHARFQDIAASVLKKN